MSVAVLPVGTTVKAAEAPSSLVRAELAYEAPDRGAGGTVRSRPRPDYDADGLPLGAFRAYPKLAVAAAYDSNPYRTAEADRGDVLTTVQPAVRIESDWSRHQLVLLGSADLGIYARNDSENFTDASLEARGRVDLYEALRFEVSGGAAHLHEDRGSVDGSGGAEPVTYLRWHGQAALAGDFGRFGYRAGFGYARHDYEDVSAIGGGVLNQDDRDHRSYGGFARLNYAALEETGIFLAGNYTLTDFDAATDDSGVNRDRHSRKLVAGLEMDWGGVTFGQVYAGWFGEMFDDATLDGASGFTAGAELTANVTPLTTVTLRGARQLRATVTPGASSLVETEVGAGVDHELRRNIILGAAITGRRLAFEGLERTDDHLAASIGADWLLSRNVHLALQYEFDTRDSHGVAAVHDWQRHTAALRLLLQR